MQDTFTHKDGTTLYCDSLYASCSASRSLHVFLVPTAANMLQVHRKRFAVLTRFVDELEDSLNPEETQVVERNKAGATDQSDRDSSERSMQG